MIHMTTRISVWLMQMTNAHTTWIQKKIEAEHDKYLETTMYQSTMGSMFMRKR